MLDRRPRPQTIEGMTIGRRFRLLRHRTTRWFQPPVRSGTEPAVVGYDQAPPLLSRGTKRPVPLH